MAQSFHSRFSAKGKIYRYRIWNAEVLPPLENGRAWHIRNAIDVEDMATAAQDFCGEHDFASFAANRGTPETNTVRKIRNVRVTRVYWYSWASVYTGDIFRFTGLRTYDPSSQTLSDKPALAAYVDSARRHEACVKNSAGACQ